MNNILIFFGLVTFLLFPREQKHEGKAGAEKIDIHICSRIPNVTIINGKYLGNNTNNYYGDIAPSSLNVIWKHYLGYGKSVVKQAEGEEVFMGAGWTGQPLIVREKNDKFLIIGAYDHNLKKINAATGELCWQYMFDDIIKGTGNIWLNRKATSNNDRYIILQGSRKGLHNSLFASSVPSFRAVSYASGKEIWKFDVRRTDSYSRDVDGTPLILDDTVYLGLENGLFTVLNPDLQKLSEVNGMLQPEKLGEHYLYTKHDIAKHGGNLVTESTPCLLGTHIYITAGSGHVYGYNVLTDSIDWDLNIGADMNGSPVVTLDSCLIITIEKQYIAGQGGVMKINPLHPPDSCVVWFFPTDDNNYGDWQGGVIGSAAVNDKYAPDDSMIYAAFIGIDGYLYVVRHNSLADNETATSPDGRTIYPVPELIFKACIGPSISTPIFTTDRLIAAGYQGIFLFDYQKNNGFWLLDNELGVFESTPVADEGKIYIASRDGYLYCFSDTLQHLAEQPAVIKTSLIAFTPIPDMNQSGNSRMPFPVFYAPVPDIHDPIAEHIVFPAVPDVNASVKRAKRRDVYRKEREKTYAAALKLSAGLAKNKPEQEDINDNEEKHYHVIAGCFSIKENALNFCEKLKKQGYPSEYFYPGKGFWFVPFYSFATREEANICLKKVTSAGNADAWVMKF